MDVGRVFELLDKYNMRNEAELECKGRKNDIAPYDMRGYNKVYCEFLLKQWIKFRDQLVGLQKIDCKCWNTIPEEIKPFIRSAISQDILFLRRTFVADGIIM